MDSSLTHQWLPPEGRSLDIKGNQSPNTSVRPANGTSSRTRHRASGTLSTPWSSTSRDWPTKSMRVGSRIHAPVCLCRLMSKTGRPPTSLEGRVVQTRTQGLILGTRHLGVDLVTGFGTAGGTCPRSRRSVRRGSVLFCQAGIVARYALGFQEVHCSYTI